MRADADHAECADHADRGETLIELMVAMMIMGTAILALLGGLATAIRVADIHRKQATAGALVRDFAEAVQTEVAASPSAYRACADLAQYGSTFDPPEDGYDPTVVTVQYWNGTAFTNLCTTATDSGVQRLTLRVTNSSISPTVAETLDIIIRKPCRPTTDFPGDLACA
jgi:type II secretory pathway pseudopilin PulG